MGQSQNQRQDTQDKREGNCAGCDPDFKLVIPRLHSETAFDRLETATTPKFPIIRDVVWKQPPEPSAHHHKFDIIHKNSANKTNQMKQELRNPQLTDRASQTLPPKGIQLQSYGAIPSESN